MSKIFLVLLFSISAMAYVPTIESIFRNGANPDVTSNALVLNMNLQKVESTSNVDHAGIKLVYNFWGESQLKLAQLTYANASFADSDMMDKKFWGNFTPKIANMNKSLEQGLLFASLNSLLINDGSFMVDYLKEIGVAVKNNTELISPEKFQLIQKYKNYLGKPADNNPLKPEQEEEKRKIEKTLRDPLYQRQNLITFGMYDHKNGWLVKDEKFEAFIEDESRLLLRVSYKTDKGVIDILFKDYIMFDGIHRFPRYIYLRDQENNSWILETKALRYFQEKEPEMLSRLQKYDLLLKGKESFKHECNFLY